MTDKPKFKTYEELEVALANDPESVGFASNPDPDCKLCYGRGYVGRNIVKKQVIVCPVCMERKEPAVIKIKGIGDKVK